MTAVVIPFPKKFYPVCVRPTRDGRGWQVVWRGWVWHHATRSAALADATAIACAQNARVLERADGGAS
jgi:hypothetical protein